MPVLYDHPPRVAFWIPVLFAPSFAFFMVRSATADQLRVEQEGIVAAAQVTAKHPRDHQTVAVSYTVGGRGYEQRVQPHERFVGYDGIKVGDSITITYLPSDPNVVFGGRPVGARYQPWGAGLFGLLSGLWIGARNVARIRARRERMRESDDPRLG